jgi:hypothetical protein
MSRKPFTAEIMFFHFTMQEYKYYVENNMLPLNSTLVEDVWHTKNLQKAKKENNKQELKLLYKGKEKEDKIFALCLDTSDAWIEFAKSEKIVNFLKHKYDVDLPYLHEILVKDVSQPNGYETLYMHVQPAKQGIPMDWVYYAGYEEITSKAITEENNIEKRRLLMMEYGIANYLKDIEILQEDKYGQLISANIDSQVNGISGLVEKQKFVKVINGTVEPLENQEFLRKRGMLTDDGHKIYYIPVLDDVTTAKQGIAKSWDIPEEWLPEKGFYIET